MTEHQSRFWWWFGVAVAVNATLAIGILAGDPMSALMVVAGVAPAGAALHHWLRIRRMSRK